MPRPIKKKTRKKDIGSETEYRIRFMTSEINCRKKRRRFSLQPDRIERRGGDCRNSLLPVYHRSESTSARTSAITHTTISTRKKACQSRNSISRPLTFSSRHTAQENLRGCFIYRKLLLRTRKYDDALKTLNDFTNKYRTQKTSFPSLTRR